ncbi:MAG: GH25 family lysozyme [Ferruginibacter sp.]
MAKRKKGIGKIVSVTFISLIIISVGFYYARDLHFKINSKAKYKEFGIYLPAKYIIHGIDVSRYQNNISWDMVKNMEDKGVKLHFAFMKATEGVSLSDPKFYNNWRNAKKHGVIRGAYHYFKPSFSGKEQAKIFFKKVNLEEGDLPPVLDVEEIGNVSIKVLIERIQEWLDIVELKYGVKPIIYTNPHLYNKYFKNVFDEYLLWVAHYKTNEPGVKREWSFWQHSEVGRVNGINANVDFNVFSGDSLEFEKLLIR